MRNLPAPVLDQVNRLEAESPQAMVAVFLPSGDYLYASASHEPLLGYSPQALLRRNLMQIIAPEDLPHLQLGFMDTVLHGKSVTISVRLQHRSGRLVPVKAEAWHVPGSGPGAAGQGFIIGRAAPVEPGPQ